MLRNKLSLKEQKVTHLITKCFTATGTRKFINVYKQLPLDPNVS